MARCWVYLHTLGGTRRCVRLDHHDGPHDYEPTIRPIGPVALSPFVRRALAAELPAKETR